MNNLELREKIARNIILTTKCPKRVGEVLADQILSLLHPLLVEELEKILSELANNCFDEGRGMKETTIQIEIDKAMHALSGRLPKGEKISITIRVDIDENDNLISPIVIYGEKITKIGLYLIYGIRYWIVVGNRIPNPPEEKKEYCLCGVNRQVVYGGTLTQEQIDRLPCSHCGKPLPKKRIEPIDVYNNPVLLDAPNGESIMELKIKLNKLTCFTYTINLI